MTFTFVLANAENFVEALQYWQKHAHALPVASDPSSAADDQAGPTQTSVSLHYADAAMAITPSSPSSISPALLARIMLAAHHPVISSVRRHPQAGWTLVKHKIHRLDAILDGEQDVDMQ